MATQTINYPCLAGLSGLSLRLRSLSTLAIVATQSSAEATASNGVQTAAFTDIAAGNYLLQLIEGTDVLGQDVITLTLTTGQFWPESFTASSGDDAFAISDGDINKIVSRVQAVSGGIVAAQDASALYITEGDTWTQDVESLGSLTGKTVVFMIKRELRDTDAEAIITIHETDGMTRLNGAIPSSGQEAWGSIEILDANAGDIRLRLESDATVRLKSGTYVDGVKLLENGADTTVRQRGKTIISAGPINAIT